VHLLNQFSMYKDMAVADRQPFPRGSRISQIIASNPQRKKAAKDAGKMVLRQRE